MKKVLTYSLIFLLIILSTSQKSTKNNDKSYVDGEIMIKVAPELVMDQAGVISTLEQDFQYIHLDYMEKLSDRLGIMLFKFTPEILPDESVLREFRRHPMIEIAQFNHFIENRETIPSDQYFNQQWNMYNTGQNGGTADADIDATNAWDIATGEVTALGDSIIIAIVDDGFDLDHEDLIFWVNSQEIAGNGIDDDGNGYIDDHVGYNAYNNTGNVTQADHGTHVSGIASAQGNNDRGVAGVNWDTKIMAVQGSSTVESVVVRAYSYVYEMRKRYNESNGSTGAFIVSTNSSFGVNYGWPEDYPLWGAMYDSMGVEGILSAAATANGSWNVDEEGDIPTAFTNESLISVTNTDNKDILSYSAAWGPVSIDLGAPGTAIYSTKQNNSYGLKTGCSMSSPHVAGAVALMYAAAPADLLEAYDDDPAGVALVMKQYLLNGVDEQPSLANKTVSGGRLNVNKSIQLMLNPVLSAFPMSVYQPIQPNDLDTVVVTLTNNMSTPWNYTMLYPDTAHWMSLSKTGGTIVGGGTDSFNIYFDSQGLGYHYYSTYLTIKYADTLQYKLPVAIDVMPNVGVSEPGDLASGISLSTYPNPFADKVSIRLSLNRPAATGISVYSVTGRKVRQISYNYLSAGEHQLAWDGRDDTGSPVPDGMYFIKLTSGNQEVTGKVLKR